MRLYEHGAESREPRSHDVEPTTKLVEILDIDETEFIFLEDGEEPLELHITIEALVADGARSVHVHRHRSRTIEVEVFYNGVTHERKFSPGTRFSKVVAWAIEAYGIDEVAAIDLTLHVPGDDSDIDGSVHLGSLLGKHDCRIALNLGPVHRFAG